jgi:hypothetical protein
MGGGGGGSVDSFQQHPQHQPQSSTNRVPRTVWELQAEKAMQTTLVSKDELLFLILN